MTFKQLPSEIVLEDNLGDLQFGNHVPLWTEDIETPAAGNAVHIVDVCDCYNPWHIDGNLGKTRNRFCYVSCDAGLGAFRKGWIGYYDMFIPVPDHNTVEGVRVDVAGPANITSPGTEWWQQGPPYFQKEEINEHQAGLAVGEAFTCITSFNDEWAVFGTTVGRVGIFNTRTLKVVFDAVGWNASPIIRITRAATGFVGVTRYFAWGVDNILTTFTLDRNGIRAGWAVVDLTGVAVTGTPLTASWEIVDVCASPDGSRFVLKFRDTGGANASGLHYIQWATAGPVIYGTAIAAAWDPGPNDTQRMLAMEFINNDWVLIMGQQGLAAWYQVPNPTGFGVAPRAGALIDIKIKYDTHIMMTHLIPYMDGTKAIICGVYKETYDNVADIGAEIPQSRDRRSVIFTADLVPGDGDTESITLVPIYYLGSPATSYPLEERYTDYWFPYQLPGAWNAGDRQYKPTIYRGERRFGRDEFLLVASGRPYAITVGVKPDSPTVSAAGENSTSNKIEWHPYLNTHEFEQHIAYQYIERAHCSGELEPPGSYEPIWASDKNIWEYEDEDIDLDEWPCSHIDREHPTIPPQQRDSCDFYDEIGLVHQTEIHDYDPTQDDWPEGRKFWYKYHIVSYYNIESTGVPQQAKTHSPIQPVQINDESDMNLEWLNITKTAREVALQWDWTSKGTTAAADFSRWQMAIFEDQNPSVLTGTWLTQFHYPQPHAYYGTSVPFQYILPWNTDTNHPIHCYAFDASFSETVKTATVDLKYWKQIHDNVTDSTDRRQGRLLPDTNYIMSMIGWDNGGLWRAAAKETYVPASATNCYNEEMTLDRQLLEVRTNPETKFAAVCNFDNEDTEDRLFYRRNEIQDADGLDTQPVGGVNPNYIALAQEFYVEKEVDIVSLDFFITSIDNAALIGLFHTAIFPDDNQEPYLCPPFAPNYVPGTAVQWDPDGALPLFKDLVTGTDNPNNWDFRTDSFPGQPIPPGPITLRPGRYWFVMWCFLKVGLPNLNYNITTLRYSDNQEHHLWQLNEPGAWTQNEEQDMKLNLYFADDHLSEGFVTESGELLTFDFNRSSVISGVDAIFIDNGYQPATEKWFALSGTLVDRAYNGDGTATVTPAAAGLAMEAVPNDSYGVESRDMLIKTRIRPNAAPPAGESVVNFDLHTMSNRYVYNTIRQRLYRVRYNLTTGRIQIFHYNKTVVTTVWDNGLGATIPLSPFTVGQFDKIWIKLVDNTISLFIEKDGLTVEENYDIGNSLVKVVIGDEYDDFYGTCDYGYFVFYVEVGSTITYDYIQLFGQHTLKNITKGLFMDWGDETTSGFVPALEIEKIYSIDADDLTENYVAEVHGTNAYDSADLGFVPTWLFYPTPVPEDDYRRQIFDFWVDNAVPTAILNIPDTWYVSSTVPIDAIGSNDPEGGQLVYYWDFGDGATDTTTSPYVAHTYNALGIFSISLYVVDEVGNISTTVTDIITILELFADFMPLDLDINTQDLVANVLTSESMSRSTGLTSANIVDKCGSELQDSLPGGRVFQLAGVHIPPACCCEATHDYELVFNLESICTRNYVYGEEAPLYGESAQCTKIYYNGNPPAPRTRIVGDTDAAGPVEYSQASRMPVGGFLMCKIDLYCTAKVITLVPWGIQVTIQGTAAGGPDGIPIAVDTYYPSIGYGQIEVGWNSFWFGGDPVWIPTGTHWIVVEPVPCPFVPGGAPDFIRLGMVEKGFHEECTPGCIGIGCGFAPVGTNPEEFMMKIYALQ